MVLSRRFTALALVMLAACGQSLFDANREGRGPSDGATGDSPPLTACSAPCIADAALDFDGTPNGAGGRWRYLDDSRNRFWGQMTGDASGMASPDGSNHITPCAARPDAAACKALSRALLFSAAGPTVAADPAIELTAASAQELRLELRAFAPPGGGDPTIRIYRNSREDVLFTGTAPAGRALDQTITLDALTGDRFFVAVEPTSGDGATDVGIQLTAIATGARFPTTCQLALAFEVKTGSSVQDRCSGAIYTLRLDSGAQAPLQLIPGPFVEQGYAAAIQSGAHFEEIASPRTIDHSRDVTVQFWAEVKAFSGTSPAVAFSDLDGDTGGGLAIAIAPAMLPDTTLSIDTAVGTSIVNLAGADPARQSWQLVRVVHTSAGIHACINGRRVATSSASSTGYATATAPRIGKGTRAGTTQALFDGKIDDLRVITGALPCEP